MNHDDFVKEYNSIVERALAFTKQACREGLLSLEELIDEEKYIQRDIFEYGVRLVIDGNDYDLINAILTNIVELELDKDKKKLKAIQKEAVLAICAGTRPSMLLLMLNSFVNICVEDTMKRYKALCEEEYKSWKAEKTENRLKSWLRRQFAKGEN